MYIIAGKVNDIWQTKLRDLIRDMVSLTISILVAVCNFAMAAYPAANGGAGVMS